MDSTKNNQKFSDFLTEEEKEIANRNIMAHYNIDLDEFDRMYIEQGGKCAICRADTTFKNKAVTNNRHDKRFCIDHCHSSGRVRGLLCNACNGNLGGLEALLPNMNRTFEYLGLNLIVGHSIQARRSRIMLAVQKADQERN